MWKAGRIVRRGDCFYVQKERCRIAGDVMEAVRGWWGRKNGRIGWRNDVNGRRVAFFAGFLYFCNVFDFRAWNIGLNIGLNISGY